LPVGKGPRKKRGKREASRLARKRNRNAGPVLQQRKGGVFRKLQEGTQRRNFPRGIGKEFGNSCLLEIAEGGNSPFYTRKGGRKMPLSMLWRIKQKKERKKKRGEGRVSRVKKRTITPQQQ